MLDNVSQSCELWSSVSSWCISCNIFLASNSFFHLCFRFRIGFTFLIRETTNCRNSSVSSEKGDDESGQFKIALGPDFESTLDSQFNYLQKIRRKNLKILKLQQHRPEAFVLMAWFDVPFELEWTLEFLKGVLNAFFSLKSFLVELLKMRLNAKVWN